MAQETRIASEIITPGGQLIEERGSRVSWGAILSGTLITVATQLLFTLLGSAIGMSAFNPEQGDAWSRGATIAVGLYFFVTLLVSLFLGGFVASRLAGIKPRQTGVLHGLSVWAVMASFSAFAIGSGVTGVLAGAFNLASEGALTAGSRIQEPGKVEDKARGLMGEAQKRAEEFRAKAPQIAGQVANVTASTSWVAFFTLLFGAFAAALGGAAGSPLRPRRERHERIQRRAA